MECNGDFLMVTKIREGFCPGRERNAQVDGVGIRQDMRAPTSRDLVPQLRVTGPYQDRTDASYVRLQSVLDFQEWRQPRHSNLPSKPRARVPAQKEFPLGKI